MKRIIILLIPALCLLQGCPEPSEFQLVQRELLNGTNHPLSVAFYASDSAYEKFILLKGESISYDGQYIIDLGSEVLEGFGWVTMDSMRVDLADSVRVVYYPDYEGCEVRNPIFTTYPNECNGYVNRNVQDTVVSTFTFTDTDFEDAEVIGD